MSTIKLLINFLISATLLVIPFVSSPTVLAVTDGDRDAGDNLQCTVLITKTSGGPPVPPVYSNSKFNVTVTGSSANKTYRAYLWDRNHTTSDNYTKQQQSGVALTYLTFGPFNTGGYLDPNLSPYEVRVEDITNGSGVLCGTTGPFTVRDPSTGGGGGGGTSGSVQGASTCKDGSPGVETALGCIKGDVGSLVNNVFGFVLGFAGAIAILLIIIGGFKVATSQGNPDALAEGKDTITHAIIGLVFILLATTILSIIGIDILNLGHFLKSGGGVIIK